MLIYIIMYNIDVNFFVLLIILLFQILRCKYIALPLVGLSTLHRQHECSVRKHIQHLALCVALSLGTLSTLVTCSRSAVARWYSG